MPKAATKKDETKAKKRTKKDPNAPKRPTGAYFYFCGEKRAALKKEKPELTAPETAKEMGAMWKTLSDDDKKPFYAMAEKDKARYAKEDAAYKKKPKPKSDDEEEEDPPEDAEESE